MQFEIYHINMQEDKTIAWSPIKAIQMLKPELDSRLKFTPAKVRILCRSQILNLPWVGFISTTCLKLTPLKPIIYVLRKG